MLGICIDYYVAELAPLLEKLRARVLGPVRVLPRGKSLLVQVEHLVKRGR